MFAWYSTASFLVSAVAITVLTLHYLKSIGYLSNVTDEHMHDLGKYLFGFSVFWTYLWFSQFMLIWYCNNGEETVYFQTRMNEFTGLFYINLIINFAVPFLVLIRNTAKRRAGIMVFMASLLLFGHWLDFFLMIKPALWEAITHGHAAVAEGAKAVGEHAEGAHEVVSHSVVGFKFPGLLELGTFIGFAGLYAFGILRNLTQASLVPVNDPYMEESLYHHV